MFASRKQEVTTFYKNSCFVIDITIKCKEITDNGIIWDNAELATYTYCTLEFKKNIEYTNRMLYDILCDSFSNCNSNYKFRYNPIEYDIIRDNYKHAWYITDEKRAAYKIKFDFNTVVDKLFGMPKEFNVM